MSFSLPSDLSPWYADGVYGNAFCTSSDVGNMQTEELFYALPVDVQEKIRSLMVELKKQSDGGHRPSSGYKAYQINNIPDLFSRRILFMNPLNQWYINN